jgi:hypothetical protein
MTYAQYGTVSAADFNTLVGGNPTTTANTLNATWATGGSSAGYGQTAIANVSVGSNVAAVGAWANLVNVTASAASHQGMAITSVTAPVAGGTITYLSAIPTNLTTIYGSRLSAAIQGSTSANSANRATTWNNNLVATFTASFANGNAARFFFNSGGQLKLTFSAPTGTAINNSLNALATAVGTVVISAPSSGAITVAAVSYNGVTKIGGSGTVNAISTNTGYYGLGTANTQLFKQLVASAPVGYTNTNINILAKTNGTQGTNLDNGSIITIYCNWAELSSTGLTAAAGANSILTVAFPETTYLTSNSWGAVTTTAVVTGT